MSGGVRVGIIAGRVFVRMTGASGYLIAEMSAEQATELAQRLIRAAGHTLDDAAVFDNLDTLIRASNNV